MDSLRPEGYHAIFASNNYHIFRAGMYADQAHVKADGIGSHTAFYYLPNAFYENISPFCSCTKKDMR